VKKSLLILAVAVLFLPCKSWAQGCTPDTSNIANNSSNGPALSVIRALDGNPYYVTSTVWIDDGAGNVGHGATITPYYNAPIYWQNFNASSSTIQWQYTDSNGNVGAWQTLSAPGNPFYFLPVNYGIYSGTVKFKITANGQNGGWTQDFLDIRIAKGYATSQLLDADGFKSNYYVQASGSTTGAAIMDPTTCDSAEAAIHTPHVYLTLTNNTTGHSISAQGDGSGVCATCYMSVSAQTGLMEMDPNDSISATEQGQVECTFGGMIMAFEWPQIAIEFAFTYFVDEGKPGTYRACGFDSNKTCQYYLVTPVCSPQTTPADFGGIGNEFTIQTVATYKRAPSGVAEVFQERVGGPGFPWFQIPLGAFNLLDMYVARMFPGIDGVSWTLNSVIRGIWQSNMNANYDCTSYDASPRYWGIPLHQYWKWPARYGQSNGFFIPNPSM